MKKAERVFAIDLIVPDLEIASDFIEAVTEPESKQRVDGFSCYTFDSFDIMLSESALIDTGVAQGVILHLKVEDVDAKVLNVMNRSGLSPTFGPERTDWGTYSAIYTSESVGFSIDFYKDLGEW